MKKILSLVLAAVVLAAVLALPAAAETYLSEKVRVLMSTPEVTVTGAAKCVPAKELADARKFLSSVEGKLSNEKFVSRAPEAVVEAERQKAQKTRDLIAQLEQSEAAMRKLSN